MNSQPGGRRPRVPDDSFARDAMEFALVSSDDDEQDVRRKVLEERRKKRKTGQSRQPVSPFICMDTPSLSSGDSMDTPQVSEVEIPKEDKPATLPSPAPSGSGSDWEEESCMSIDDRIFTGDVQGAVDKVYSILGQDPSGQISSDWTKECLLHTITAACPDGLPINTNGRGEPTWRTKTIVGDDPPPQPREKGKQRQPRTVVPSEAKKNKKQTVPPTRRTPGGHAQPAHNSGKRQETLRGAYTPTL